MKQKLSIFGALISLFTAGMLLYLVPLVQANPTSTITVTTTSDVIASDGQCALREAIIAANSDAAFNDCAAGSGSDTIQFDAALTTPATFVLTLSGSGEDAGYTGDLDLTGTLTIIGAGQTNTIIDGNGSDRVFDIRPGAHATISGVTVRNGSSVDGGGIRVQGSLTLADSTVSNNTTGGVFNNGGGMVLTAVRVVNNLGGYGLQNLNQGSLTFTGGQISSNNGGGISNATAAATLRNLSITGNTVGGGVRNTGATLSQLTLSYSTVSSNSATNGGGVYNEGVGAIAGIANTTISGNTATATGGGAYNFGIMTISNSTLDDNGASAGGGIDHAGGTLSLSNATISNNRAADNGGGLYNRSSATLASVTLTGNYANGPDTGGNLFNDEAQLSIRNSIVANADADGSCFDSLGFVTSGGYNLDDANTCGFTSTGDLINSDPLLGPLQDNFGPTMTHALPSGSPAIDAANPATPGSGGNACPSKDQRGISRPQGVACDIGAYEYAAVLEDWGDLPDSYATLLNSSGAQHSLSGPILGTVIDIETDGQPNATATGDDVNDAPDDEDGVQATGNWSNAGMGYLLVTVSGGDGCLNVWLDFTDGTDLLSGGDGDFADIYSIGGTFPEHVLVNHAIGVGILQPVSFPLPASAANGALWFLRARLTPQDANGGCNAAEAYAGSVSPGGLASGGEVEDYQIAFGPTALTLEEISVEMAGSEAAWVVAGILFLLAALTGVLFVIQRNRRQFR